MVILRWERGKNTLVYIPGLKGIVELILIQDGKVLAIEIEVSCVVEGSIEGYSLIWEHYNDWMLITLHWMLYKGQLLMDLVVD